MIVGPGAVPQRADSTLADAVTTTIRSMIGTGELAPGQPVVIDHVARQLGVSAQPVREALKVLESEGRVTHVAHRGVQVVALTGDELREVYRLRDIIEDEAIRRSVVAFPSGAADELDRRTDALAAAMASDEPEMVLAANREFHRFLRSFNPIRRLDDLVVQLRAVSAPYRRRFLEQRSYWPQLLADHRAIVDGVRRADDDAVIAAVRRQRTVTVGALLAAGDVLAQPKVPDPP